MYILAAILPVIYCSFGIKDEPYWRKTSTITWKKKNETRTNEKRFKQHWFPGMIIIISIIIPIPGIIFIGWIRLALFSISLVVFVIGKILIAREMTRVGNKYTELDNVLVSARIDNELESVQIVK